MDPSTYDDLLARLDREACAANLERAIHATERGPRGAYPLVRYRTRGPGLAARTLLVTAGFHGEEPAGPLFLATPGTLARAALEAEARGVALDVFPCVNPTGFEAGTRYNIRGERPNNDALRYELSDGHVTGELPSPRTPFRRWSPFRAGPFETRALLAALEAVPAPDAALDLHQDAGIRGPATYAYILGPRRDFRPILAVATRRLPVHRDSPVSFGATDAEGLIEAHDGSFTDYLFRRGARHAACVETSTDAPLEASAAVFGAWLRGMILLAGR